MHPENIGRKPSCNVQRVDTFICMNSTECSTESSTVSGPDGGWVGPGVMDLNAVFRHAPPLPPQIPILLATS